MNVLSRTGHTPRVAASLGRPSAALALAYPATLGLALPDAQGPMAWVIAGLAILLLIGLLVLLHCFRVSRRIEQDHQLRQIEAERPRGDHNHPPADPFA